MYLTSQQIADFKKKYGVTGTSPGSGTSLGSRGISKPEDRISRLRAGITQTENTRGSVLNEFQNNTEQPVLNNINTTKKFPSPSNPITQAQYQQQEAENSTATSRILDKVSGGIQKGYDWFTNLAPVKQFAEGTGKLVGGVSGAVTGLEGGILETGKQIYRGATGQGFDANAIVDTATDFAKEGYQFGKNIGEAAAPASTLGAAGRVINLALAGGMGYSGYKEFKEGYQTGDYVKMYEGLQNMAVSGFGLKEGLAKGQQGAFIDPKLKAQIKSEIDYLRNTTPEQHFTKAAETYRDLINPTKGEIKKTEVKKGQSLDPSFRRMAEQGLIIEKDAAGKLDTEQARKKVQDNIDVQENKLQDILSKQQNQRIDLEQVRYNAKKAISEQKTVKAEDKLAQQKEVDSIINAEITARKMNRETQTRLDVSSPVVTDANNIKRSMWKATAFDANRPFKGTASYEIGNTINKMISEKVPESSSLNLEMSKDIQVKKLLEEAHGRPIKGGRLGGYFAGMAGSVIGNSLKVPIIGPVLGKIGAESLHSYITSPERITTKLSKQSDAIKTTPGSFLKSQQGKGGLSIEDVSKNPKILKSREYVGNRLVEALPKVQDLVNTGAVTPDQYAALSRIMDRFDKMTETPKDIERVNAFLDKIQPELKAYDKYGVNKSIPLNGRRAYVNGKTILKPLK